MDKLCVPRLSSVDQTGLVLDVDTIRTLMPVVAFSWITVSDGSMYQLPPGILQSWAQDSQGLSGQVEFGELPDGRVYADFLLTDGG